MFSWYNTTKRIESLYQFSKGIINGKNGTELIKKYQEAIDYLVPEDMIAVFDHLILDNIPNELPRSRTNEVSKQNYLLIRSRASGN